MPRRFSYTAASAALIAALALSGCATGSTPQTAATPTPSSASPETSPTPSDTTAIPLVAAGEQPPSIGEGDCADAIPVAALEAAVGVTGIEVALRDPLWTRSVTNLGGLTCEWSADGSSGSISIIASHALGDAALTAESRAIYFEACSWGCAWEWSADGVWITGSESDLPDLGREEADRRAAIVGPEVAAAVSDSLDQWRLDRTAWWPVRGCDEVAAAIGAALGVALTAQYAGYHDTAGPATELGDAASARTWCALGLSGAVVASVSFQSGAAWDVPWAGEGEPVVVEPESVTAFHSRNGGYVGSNRYELTDGVNAATVEPADESPIDSQELLDAVAAYMAAGLE